ncbi:MAG: DUF3370 family protein, partial [Cyanobacteria bacterium J06627_32]
MFSLLFLLSLVSEVNDPAVSQLWRSQAQTPQSSLQSSLIAQASGDIVTVPQTVRSLPGGLDRVPVFNSNSPDISGSEFVEMFVVANTGSAHTHK